MEWGMERTTTLEELTDMESRLLQDGLRPNADQVERMLHLWHLYLRTEGGRNAARLEVKALQEAHDRENMEVQKKLDQVRVLIAKQDSFNVKYEEENQRLHAQLKQLKLEKEALRVEVTELLDQGGLGEIVASSPSEQVAYLLAERASLLERLQALEVEKCSPTMISEPVAVFRDGMDKLSFHKAVPSRGQSSWKKLLGLRKAAQNKQKLAVQSPEEESSGDTSGERQHLERDLDEASCRLSMAHKEIRRLTDELESAHMSLKAHEAKLQEVEFLKKEAEKLRLDDVSELRKAKELNERLDKEIRILRDRVRSVDNERLALLALVDEQMTTKNDNETSQTSLPEVEKAEIGTQTTADMEGEAHIRCLEDLKEKDLELQQLQERIQHLQQELSEMQLQREQVQQLLEEQEHSHRDTVEALKKELEFLGTVVKQTQAEQQDQESQKALLDHYKATAKDQECLLQHKSEEYEEMKEVLGHTIGLLRTAEAEVLSGKDKITELEKLKAELDHKNQQLESREKNAQDKQQEQQTALISAYKVFAKDQECLLQQKSEEYEEMKEVLGHTIGLLRTAEAEVLSGKDKITELEKLKAELDHKNQQLESREMTMKNAQDKQQEQQTALISACKVFAKDQECLLQQKSEEYEEMKEVLGHTIGLLRTAEAEVLSGKDKITELEKLKAELDPKNQQVFAEHNEALVRISELEKKCEAQSVELQKRQCHLDAEQNCQSQNQQLQEKPDLQQFEKLERDATSNNIYNMPVTLDFIQKRRQWLQSEGEFQQVMEDLLKENDNHRKSAMQKQCLIDQLMAQQKNNTEVLELQEEVKNLTLQLELVKAENQCLNETKSLNADLPVLRAHAQEAEKQRQLWLCSKKDLEQQIKTLQEKLALMTLSEQEFQRQVVELKATLMFMEKTEQATKLEVLELQQKVKNLNEANDQIQNQHQKQHKAQEDEKQRCLELISQKDLKISTLQDELAAITLSEHNYHVEVVDLNIKMQRMEQTTKLESDKCTDVKEQLYASQRKLQTFADEMNAILDARDKDLRFCHGKMNQLKSKLSQAKTIYLHDMRVRDNKIQEHENKCAVLKEQVDKVTETTKKMDQVNTNLLKENSRFQNKLLQEKEARKEAVRFTRSCKQRIEYLQKLVERMDRYIHDHHWKSGQKYSSSFDPPGASQSATDQSTFALGDTMRDLLDLVQNSPSLSEDMSPARSSTHTQTSENDYLNLTPPFSPVRCQAQVESNGMVAEEALQADNRRSCLTERFL